MKDAYMNLSFYQMWYFIRTIELGSYSRASQDLNVTQSTLSKCIQNIEQNLKMELFIREKNNLIPTEAAKNLYQVWKKMIVEMQEAVVDARRYMGGRSESLKIGVLDSHKSESYLWEYVEAFHDLYPDISLAVESERPEVLHKKLMENVLDVIFTVRYDMETISWTGHHMELVKETPFTVCMRADNPLVDKQVWEVKDLKECNLVMISALHLPSYNSMIVELCLKYGFFPNIVYNAQNAASQIYNLLKENDVFICDKYHKDYGSSHVISRPIKNTKSGVVMVWKNERKKYLCQFIDVVRNCRQHEQQENIQNGRMPEEEK